MTVIETTLRGDDEANRITLDREKVVQELIRKLRRAKIANDTKLYNHCRDRIIANIDGWLD